jgi:predicted porin
VKLTGSYEDEKLTTAAPALAPFAGSETRWLVGAIWTAGQHEVRGSYVQSDGRDSTAPTAAQRTTFDNADASMYTLGYIYHFSRRTALYAVAALIDNKDTGTFSISGGGSITPGGSSTGLMLGTRHSF